MARQYYRLQNTKQDRNTVFRGELERSEIQLMC